jgi:hypothetical protein
MADWITTHFAHRQPDTHLWHIYLQDKFVAPGRVGTEIHSGDGVLFYELASNPLLNSPPYPKGRQGVVVAAKIQGDRIERPPELAIGRKKNGQKVNYRWEFRTADEDKKGFVCKKCVLRILNFKPNYKMLGFGGGSGVKRLEGNQYQVLLGLFRRGCGH